MPTPPELSAEALYRQLRPQLVAYDNYRLGQPDPRHPGLYCNYRTAVECLDDAYLALQIAAYDPWA